ncbi:PTS beta-glucoside transporter subunit IIBCA [Microbacterium sp. SORGH_AS_0888]|uniref:PTS beta-glucoside transporter subunit IIBCA n=1 Tax=Microbacterium sp. SORGH_AS_0888 TaxID=3041791 RepID=UPI0027847CBA|nr:PTS beta-glucoside transporter subunit IIBCA [Microbacterium sp. SORGH_AS_0888]MDQ1129669.1 PTS system sucrose-specific IIC component [Microbacterium sp. SORGH_AS_0888]
MKHDVVARSVLTALGGSENIQAAAHCATRLRIVTVDKTLIDQAALDADPDVKGTFEAGGQFQIIIGPGDVDKVYDELVALSGVRAATKDEVKQVAGQGGNIVVRFIKMLSDIFVPVLPALIAGGLLMALNNVLTAPGLFGPDAVTTMLPALADPAALINLLAAAAFAFLPVLVAFSAGQRFGANPYLAAALGAAMVMPSLVNGYNVAEAVADGTMTYWHIFGMDVAQAGYQGTVIPVLAVVYLLSVSEKLLRRVLKGTFDFLFTPMISLLVVGLATFIAVGPAMRWVSDAITFGLSWAYESLGFLGGALFGLVYSPIVVTGLHQSFPAVELSLIAQGGSFIFAIASMANIAQGAACLAVFLLVRRGSKLRAMAGASSVSALLGITEPAIFGVNLRLQFPFFIGMGAAAVAGGFISALGVKAISLGAAGVIGFVSIQPASIPQFALCALISFGLSFGVTLAYGRWRVSRGRPLDPAEGVAPLVPVPAEPEASEPVVAPTTVPAASDAETALVDIVSPARGRLIPLSEVPDPMFSGGVLGGGMAVVPSEGEVTAPAAGVLTAVFPTGHAYGITTDEGVEVLVHIGIDTVNLAGAHFTALVSAGERVEVGTPLARVDWTAVRAAGYDTTTPIVITNSDIFEVVAAVEPTEVAPGEPIFHVHHSEVAPRV